MKAVAIIGLGIMGHGIADNFLKNGYKVIVWNRTSDKADDLVIKRATLAQSVQDAVKQADLAYQQKYHPEQQADFMFDNSGNDNV